MVHNDFSERYHFGDRAVHSAVDEWAHLTTEAMKALEEKDSISLGELMNRNFDIRRSVMNIAAKNIEMVETARFV